MAKIYTLATAILTFAFALASFAAIPVRWTTDAYKVKPLVYECYHGETLDMAAALTAYGEPLDFAGKTARLYWQTNGMAAAWWSTNAFVRSEAGATNVLSAIWSGAYDTGAASVTGFIGVEGENYRAAFQLNFRASPGFSPNQIQMLPKTIDWAKVANANVDAAPFARKGEGGGGISAQTATNISSVVVTNNVAPWAMAGKSEPQGMTTNAVSGIITNHVESGYLCTVAASQEMTNGKLDKSDGHGNTITWQSGSLDVSGIGVHNFSIDCYAGIALFPNFTLSACFIKDEGDNYLHNKADKATTLSGYGITNAYTKAEADANFIPANSDYPFAWIRGGFQWDTSAHFFGDVESDGYFIALNWDHIKSGNQNLIDYLSGGEWNTATNRFAKLSDIGVSAQTATNIAEAVVNSQFTTNNAALVTVVTNLAPSKARGISLADPVRHCSWYQCVTNGVFFWIVEE